MNHMSGSCLLAAGLWLCAFLAPAQIPSNDLLLRIGVDQAGGNAFQGEVASVRLYSRALSAGELAGLAKAPREGEGAGQGIVGEWLHPRLPLVSDQKFGFPEGCTIEAWVRPEAGTSGRIVDKITPGGSDGFLLDTWPGNAVRLIVGNETLTQTWPHTNQWTHVAATVDTAGHLALFVNGVCTAGTAPEPEDVTVMGATEGPGDALTLWYRRPTARWTEASPVGNGRLGGMVWGGVKRERIDLNEDTLWSGEPYDNLNPRGLAALPEIRRLLRAGNDPEAQRLVERDMNGKYNQSYQPLGDLTIEFPFAGEVTHYRRELDLMRAVARVQFEYQGVHYTREVFASTPGQAIVVRLAGDRPGMVSFTASLGCQLHHDTKAAAGVLRLAGRCPAHVEPGYSGQGVVWDDAPDGKGMRFETRLVPVAEGGRVTVTDEGIKAEGCDSVMLLLVAATSYNGPWKSPSREGKDPGQLCETSLTPLAGKTYAVLQGAHAADYQRLFNRVSVDLGHSEAEKEPTDLRLRLPGTDREHGDGARTAAELR